MADPVATTAPRASVAEDLVDVFYAPSAVFERRRQSSPWPQIIIVSVLFATAAYISLSPLAPVVDAELQRQMARATAANANLTAEQMATAQSFGRVSMLAGSVLGAPIAILVVGLVLWMVGKLFGAEQPLRASFLVVALSFMPRILETLLGALQAFVVDVNAIPSIWAASLTPARFAGADTPESMVMLLSRFGPFLIWAYGILAIGLAVTGRISKGKAAAAAAIVWVLGTLAQVLPAMMRG